MKYLGKITDNKDLVTKEYVDNAVAGGIVTGVKGNSESSYRTGDVNITAANIGAVPTSRTVNSKALSSNITLSASDVSALATADLYTRSNAGGCDWSTATANMVIAKSALAFWNGSYDGATSNLQRLNATVYVGGTQMKDFIKDQGTSSSWKYRKWNSGKIEAWIYNLDLGNQTPAVWVSPIRYKDVSITIPSGIFSSAPILYITSTDNQWGVFSALASSATAASIRFITAASAASSPNINIYAVSQ